jgi:cytidyltransferase-like protein
MGDDKIKTLEELINLISNLKTQGKKIVHCHGVFDFVHFGHVEHFIAAKKKGDILIVTLTPDRFIQKGPGRPYFNEEIRIKYLASLEVIDYVSLNKWDNAIEIIKLLKPDFYVKGKEVLGNKNIDEIKNGSETKSNLTLEIEALESVGGQFYLTDEMTFSSSSLINKFGELIPEETKNFLNKIKKEFNVEDIINILNSLKNLKVLVIGDSIFDEFIFVKALDKAGKEPLVAYSYLNSEIQLGGVFAVANQVACFSENVTLITCIGDDHYYFIDDRLDKSIQRNIFIQKSMKTITKTRYIDDYKKIKLFEIYNCEELEINNESENRIIKYLKDAISNFDLIIISDFGHGMISENIKNILSQSQKFLAINTQLNGGNMGYNYITKYNRADYISLNEKEIRIPFQEKKSEINIPIQKLSKYFNINKINITLGKLGSVYYYYNNFYKCPAFTKDSIDTTGAGDKILSIGSLLAYKNVNPNIFLFLTNSVGAISVNIIGNRRSIDHIELKKFINYILK